ncbi:MAG TPA: hypothetical protein VHF26_06825 [Trebonia sp.]|nr:hypothetical protein [Trebonia sp.]
MITGITKISHIETKQDMSRWTRAHADVPGITWSVYPGPGGTMIIVEHTEDRCTLTRTAAPAELAAPAAAAMENVPSFESIASIESAGITRASA